MVRSWDVQQSRQVTASQRKLSSDGIISEADIELLNYTILQPGYLLDTDATGKIADPKKVNNYADTVKGQHEKISIPRDDVALTII